MSDEKIPSDTVGRLSRGALITLLVWPLVVGACSGYVAFQYLRAQLVLELSGRPPVAVISEVEFIEKHGSADAGLVAARNASAQLQAAGFLVLEVNQTYAAPEHVRVKP